LRERFAAQRPDHAPPGTLDDAALAQSISSLRRKLHSVRAALFTARLAGGALLLAVVAAGFTLLWVGPEPFLPRIFQGGDVVTVPELLVWWGLVIGAALFGGIVGARLLQRRARLVRAWKNRMDQVERRLEGAVAEARRRGGGLA
jgi:hypothetical protein